MNILVQILLKIITRYYKTKEIFEYSKIINLERIFVKNLLFLKNINLKLNVSSVVLQV